MAVLSDKIGVAALINRTQTEIDAIQLPDGWAIKPLSEFCIETKSGATPSRAYTEYWNKTEVPWLKSGEVHNGITIHTEEYISQLAVENTSVKLLPADTVLMAMYGVTAGEVGYLAIPATTNQAVCGMVCSNKMQAAYLFFSLLQSQGVASRLSNGGAQDNLSKNFIDSIQLIVPDDTLLCSMKLHAIIEQLTKNTKELELLLDLQSTLLSQLSSR